MKIAAFLVALLCAIASPALAKKSKPAPAPKEVCLSIEDTSEMLQATAENDVKFVILHRLEGDEFKKFNDFMRTKSNVPSDDATGLLVVGNNDPKVPIVQVLVFYKGCLGGQQFAPKEALEKDFKQFEVSKKGEAI